jgi:arylsulfatase A-like enzyme
MDQLRCYPAADVIVDKATAWLQALPEEPFFLWLHLMDPHHPYYPPEAALAATGAAEITARRARFLNSMWNRDVGAARVRRYLGEVLSLYDAGVYWVDRQISRLVRSLQDLQRWNETLMVVTADHGEQFLEHGARYHSPMGLPEQLIHVPLLLRSPEVSTAKVLDGPFSLVHLAPTILESVGVQAPQSFRGQSCWKQVKAGNLAGEPVITECVEACNNPFRREERMRSRLIAARDKSYKLVVNFREKKDFFYDLSKDPAESSPLPPGVLSSERARLLHAVRRHLEQVNSTHESDTRLRACLQEFQQLDFPEINSSLASTAS